MDSYEWILEELKRALYSVEKEERVQLKQKLLQAKRGVYCRNGTFRIDCGVLCHASGTIRVAGNVGW